MKRFISNVAIFLFTPVILSVSGLLCLIQANPVYASTLHSTEILMAQGQNHEEYNVMINTNVTQNFHQTGHTSGDMKCDPVNNHANFQIKQLEPTAFNYTNALLDNTFDTKEIFPLNNHTYFDSQFEPSQSSNFLIGTTIKKE